GPVEVRLTTYKHSKENLKILGLPVRAKIKTLSMDNIGLEVTRRLRALLVREEPDITQQDTTNNGIFTWGDRHFAIKSDPPSHPVKAGRPVAFTVECPCFR